MSRKSKHLDDLEDLDNKLYVDRSDAYSRDIMEKTYLNVIHVFFILK